MTLSAFENAVVSADNAERDSLQSPTMIINNTNGDDDHDEASELLCSKSNQTQTKDTGIKYNSQKPTWWKKLSGKGKLSKSQKRAVQVLTEDGYRLPKVPWGGFLDWNSIFVIEKEADDIWLELGFGNGDNLLALAERYPHRKFVGAEVHTGGIGNLCQRMHQAMLQQQYWKDYVEYTPELEQQYTTRQDQAERNAVAQNQDNKQIPSVKSSTLNNNIPPINSNETTIQPNNNDNDNSTAIVTNSHSLLLCPIYSNIRFHGGDGVKMLPSIPTNSLSAVLVTFPDPFPKPGNEEFRVLQQNTIMEIHRILCSKGRLYLATDHAGHFQWCHDMMDKVNQNHHHHHHHHHHSTNTDIFDTTTNDKSHQPQMLFVKVVPTLDRAQWLPVVSKYEQKGWSEGRTTLLTCWEVVK